MARAYRLNPGTAIRCRVDVPVEQPAGLTRMLCRGDEGTVLETFRNEHYNGMPLGTSIVIRPIRTMLELWFNTKRSGMGSSVAFQDIPMRPELVVPFVDINRTTRVYTVSRDLPITVHGAMFTLLPGSEVRIFGPIDRTTGHARIEILRTPNRLEDFVTRYPDSLTLGTLSRALAPR